MTKSKNVEITVLATLHADQGVDFHCSWEDDQGNVNSGPLEFPFGAGQNKLKFKLDDKTGLGLQFLEKEDDAIWFSADGCPQDGPTDDLGQITDRKLDADAVTAKRKKLALTNLNTQECTLHYALRFDGKPSGTAKAPYVCDPEIRNRGGGGNN